MRARIDYFSGPKSKGAKYELENIHLRVELPFVPTVGTMLKLTADGDYIMVADVMLDITPNGEGLIIGLEEPNDGCEKPWKQMKAEGWSLS